MLNGGWSHSSPPLPAIQSHNATMPPPPHVQNLRAEFLMVRDPKGKDLD